LGCAEKLSAGAQNIFARKRKKQGAGKNHGELPGQAGERQKDCPFFTTVGEREKRQCNSKLKTCFVRGKKNNGAAAKNLVKGGGSSGGGPEDLLVLQGGPKTRRKNVGEDKKTCTKAFFANLEKRRKKAGGSGQACKLFGKGLRGHKGAGNCVEARKRKKGGPKQESEFKLTLKQQKNKRGTRPTAFKGNVM